MFYWTEEIIFSGTKGKGERNFRVRSGEKRDVRARKDQEKGG